MGQRFNPSRPPPCTRCRDERNGPIHHDPDIPYHRTLVYGRENIYKSTLRILGVDVSSPSACGPRKWPAWSGLPGPLVGGNDLAALDDECCWVWSSGWTKGRPAGLTWVQKNDNSRELHPPGLTDLCIYPREYQVPGSLDGRVPPARLPTEPANRSES